jgi:ketosteroid isomerase-like protein
MLKKWLLHLFPTLVLPAMLVLAACQPIQAPAQQAGPTMLPWAQLSIEQKIANAMSGGPAAIAREAAILDWPAEPGSEWTVLREGSNGWTCLPDDAGFAYATPINDPLCLDEAWVPWFEALLAGREPSITRPGVVYAYPGGVAADNDDPFAAAPPAGKGLDLIPPHLGLLFPGGLEPDDFASDMHTGMPYIMYSETPYEHLMVPIVTASLAPVDPADRITNAMSAGPLEIAQDATILDWPTEPGGDWTVLREGSNGWTCLPDDNTLPTATLTNDPMCLDEMWMEWLNAAIAGREPQITRPGIGYMFQGGSVADNDDPSVLTPPEGQEWQIDPPHIMVLYPEQLEAATWSHEHDDGGPFIMFGGTPYEHLMIPVDPVVVSGAAEHTHATSEAQASTLSEREQFIKVAMDLEEAYQQEDLERVISFYAEDAISQAPGFPSDKGKAAVKAAYQAYFDTYDIQRDFHLASVEIAGDYATRTGEWTQVSTPTDGGEPITEVGRCVLAFKKVDGEWKVVWEIWNTYEPQPE